jgi:LAS superfamily LD-carboxypeptidase LdcB
VQKNIPKIISYLIISLPIFIVFVPSIATIVFEFQQKVRATTEFEKQLKAEEARKEKEARKIFLMGKFDPSQNSDFVLVPTQHTVGRKDEDKIYLDKRTLEAFLKMQNVASKEGIDLKISSATRNFDYQKNVWNNRWIRKIKEIKDGEERFKKVLEYNAVPGTSRHHWGTDIDMNDANLKYFKTENGQKVYSWLTKNAKNFGFCQVYNEKDQTRLGGYNEEKWHWSYLPLARTFTQEYKNLIENEDINGFLGEEYVLNFDLMDDYILGINPECL